MLYFNHEREVVTMWKVMAVNEKTMERLELGREKSQEDAQWQIDNNIEWDEDDVREDWILYAEEVEDEYQEPDNIDDDCGFDPYMGCYTDEC